MKNKTQKINLEQLIKKVDKKEILEMIKKINSTATLQCSPFKMEISQ